MRTIEQMVRQEVLCCVSSLVASAADGVNYMIEGRRESPAPALAYEAAELCAPLLDYEEAAIQAGWEVSLHPGRYVNGRRGLELEALDWQDVCNKESLDPYEWEIFEHWAVTDWLAVKLEAEGERVGDLGNLKVWGRTCSGQSIEMDGVIQRIYAAMMAA